MVRSPMQRACQWPGRILEVCQNSLAGQRLPPLGLWLLVVDIWFHRYKRHEKVAKNRKLRAVTPLLRESRFARRAGDVSPLRFPPDGPRRSGHTPTARQTRAMPSAGCHEAFLLPLLAAAV